MSIRLGFDLESTNRLKSICVSSPKIMERLFTQNEVSYSKQFSDWHVHLAASFCAKEAFFKALGTGLEGHRWVDVELCHFSSGEPFLTYKGKPISGQVSISHTSDTAGAVVLLFE